VLDPGQNGHTYTIFGSGGDVYVDGSTTNNSGVELPAYWKNDDRTDIAVIDPSKGGYPVGVFVAL
jgi:hypothetical protein